MEVTMKDLKKSFKLLFYGYKALLNLILSVFMLLLGLGIELLQNIQLINDPDLVIIVQPGSAIFLSCISIFAIQMMYSLNVSALVSASPMGRGLKTKLATFLAGGISYLVLAAVIVMKLILAVLHPQAGMNLWYGLVGFAVVQAVLLIYAPVMMHFFLVSLLILYVIMCGGGVLLGYYSAVETGTEISARAIMFSNTGSPGVLILISVLIVTVGIVAQYGISVLLYRQPLSKSAFGAGLKSAV